MTQVMLAHELMRFKCQYRHYYKKNVNLNFLISEMWRDNTPLFSRRK